MFHDGIKIYKRRDQEDIQDPSLSTRYTWEGDAFNSWRAPNGTAVTGTILMVTVMMQPIQIMQVSDLEQILKEEMSLGVSFHVPTAAEVLDYFANLVDSHKYVLFHDRGFKSVGTTGRRYHKCLL